VTVEQPSGVSGCDVPTGDSGIGEEHLERVEPGGRGIIEMGKDLAECGKGCFT